MLNCLDIKEHDEFTLDFTKFRKLQANVDNLNVNEIT